MNVDNDYVVPLIIYHTRKLNEWERGCNLLRPLEPIKKEL
jgi:hypothetical protein